MIIIQVIMGCENSHIADAMGMRACTMPMVFGVDNRDSQSVEKWKKKEDVSLQHAPKSDRLPAFASCPSEHVLAPLTRADIMRRLFFRRCRRPMPGLRCRRCMVARAARRNRLFFRRQLRAMSLAASSA